jgi:hypothetical protein
MHIVSALRRKRNEIAATIAAYEARIDAARTDLAAVDKIIRLFVSAAGCYETAICFEPRKILAVCPEAFEQERPLDMRPLALPSKAKGLAVLFKSVRIRVCRALLSAMKPSLIAGSGDPSGICLGKGTEPQAAQAGERNAEVVARRAASEPIPGEFFYLDWP